MSDAPADTVLDRMRHILAEQAVTDISAITRDTSPQDLGIDSLSLVEVIFSVEECFDIEVPFNANDPAASEFDISTVGTMVAAVEALIAAKG